MILKNKLKMRLKQGNLNLFHQFKGWGPNGQICPSHRLVCVGVSLCLSLYFEKIVLLGNI